MFASVRRFVGRVPRTLHDDAGTSTLAVVFGTGKSAELLVHTMSQDASSTYVPVTILDDECGRYRRRVGGIEVMGGRGNLPEVIKRTNATMLIIAIPGADAELVSELFTLGYDLGLEVRVLPSANDLFGRRVSLSDIRKVRESDLLGRRHIETDINSIAGHLGGTRVLITGAGGSVGSELSRQVHRWGPSKLFLLDRDESALHAVQLSIHGEALLDSDEAVLADIRDSACLEDVFEEIRPDVIFHAAALKHLPLLERYSGEALKTNVQATVHLLELSRQFGVKHFINISSDKAADPISVLGYSKRLSERLTARTDILADGNFVSVRFGNVLDSRGSVLTAFHEQIMSGRPLTVTHPEISRYFMTAKEAVELVIQAGAIGTGGEVLVLDMGEPVRIVDVARRLAAQAGVEAQIVYTGLRAGEKLTEDLFSEREVPVPTEHPLINRAPVPPLDPEHVMRLNASAGTPIVTQAMAALCDSAIDLTEATVG